MEVWYGDLFVAEKCIKLWLWTSLIAITGDRHIPTHVVFWKFPSMVHGPCASPVRHQHSIDCLPLSHLLLSPVSLVYRIPSLYWLLLSHFQFIASHSITFTVVRMQLRRMTCLRTRILLWSSNLMLLQLLVLNLRKQRLVVNVIVRTKQKQPCNNGDSNYSVVPNRLLLTFKSAPSRI